MIKSIFGSAIILIMCYYLKGDVCETQFNKKNFIYNYSFVYDCSFNSKDIFVLFG